jgi:hypothetical protein
VWPPASTHEAIDEKLQSKLCGQIEKTEVRI